MTGLSFKRNLHKKNFNNNSIIYSFEIKMESIIVRSHKYFSFTSASGTFWPIFILIGNTSHGVVFIIHVVCSYKNFVRFLNNKPKRKLERKRRTVIGFSMMPICPERQHFEHAMWNSFFYVSCFQNHFVRMILVW